MEFISSRYEDGSQISLEQVINYATKASESLIWFDESNRNDLSQALKLMDSYVLKSIEECTKSHFQFIRTSSNSYHNDKVNDFVF